MWENASTIVQAIQGNLDADRMPAKDEFGTRETIFMSHSKPKGDGYSHDMPTALSSLENNELHFAGLSDPPDARTAIKDKKVRGKTPGGTSCADSTGGGGEVTDPETEELKVQFLPASGAAFWTTSLTRT